jgi:hypothetical protein
MQYATQVIPQIDAEIAKLGTRPERGGTERSAAGAKKKGHFWMETSYSTIT